ncbi:MAG: hypothetical protein SOU08_00090 [Anaerococcus sp.]|nr:hypothetical protein [Anaerococcus sp.]
MRTSHGSGYRSQSAAASAARASIPSNATNEYYTTQYSEKDGWTYAASWYEVVPNTDPPKKTTKRVPVEKTRRVPKTYHRTVKGDYIGEVTSSNRNAYPNNGVKNGDWYEYAGLANRAPVITGSNTDLGTVRRDFSIEYTVNDLDGDDVNVEVRVDGRVIQYPMPIPLGVSQTINFNWNEYGIGRHTITIVATDSNQETATRSYNFTKSNAAPNISGNDLDLGGKYRDFDIEYIIQDADGDDVRVTIKVDGSIKQQKTKTSLGIRKTYHIDIDNYSIGRHTVEIIAEDSAESSTTRRYTFERVNSAPTISGYDTNLGAKNTAFTYTYQVHDDEGDQVRVVERLNGLTIRTLNNVSLDKNLNITISDEQIRKLDINKVNTIEIEASDGKTTTYRRVTFSRNNMPPIISGTDTDIGEHDKSVSYEYSATDPEGDEVYATVYLDDTVLKQRERITSGRSQSIKISGLDFLKIPKGKHKIKVEVENDKGFKSTRTVSFTRTIPRLVIQLANHGIDTGESLAKRVLVSTVGIYVANGAVIKYEVCNNGKDSKPTWEDATTMVKAGKAFNFTNESKSNSHGSINIRVTIEKGTSTMASYITSIGGSYD